MRRDEGRRQIIPLRHRFIMRINNPCRSKDDLLQTHLINRLGESVALATCGVHSLTSYQPLHFLNQPNSSTAFYPKNGWDKRTLVRRIPTVQTAL
jgi:hypothetical protein